MVGAWHRGQASLGTSRLPFPTTWSGGIFSNRRDFGSGLWAVKLFQTAAEQTSLKMYSVDVF